MGRQEMGAYSEQVHVWSGRCAAAATGVVTTVPPTCCEAVYGVPSSSRAQAMWKGVLRQCTLGRITPAAASLSGWWVVVGVEGGLALCVQQGEPHARAIACAGKWGPGQDPDHAACTDPRQSTPTP